MHPSRKSITESRHITLSTPSSERRATYFSFFSFRYFAQSAGFLFAFSRLRKNMIPTLSLRDIRDSDLDGYRIVMHQKALPGGDLEIVADHEKAARTLVANSVHDDGPGNVLLRSVDAVLF